jgi:hypothetical protein
MSIGWFLISGSFDPNIVILRYSKKVCWRRSDFRFGVGGGLALRQLPLGTAYAIWTGIGTVGTAIFGMLMLGEPAGALRLLAIALIISGIVMLKLLWPA